VSPRSPHSRPGSRFSSPISHYRRVSTARRRPRFAHGTVARPLCRADRERVVSDFGGRDRDVLDRPIFGAIRKPMCRRSFGLTSLNPFSSSMPSAPGSPPRECHRTHDVAHHVRGIVGTDVGNSSRARWVTAEDRDRDHSREPLGEAAPAPPDGYPTRVASPHPRRRRRRSP